MYRTVFELPFLRLLLQNVTLQQARDGTNGPGNTRILSSKASYTFGRQ